MASLKGVKRLKELCEKYELEGRGVLDGYPNTKLASMYNGIGPEKFPGWLRAASGCLASLGCFLDFIHPSLAPVAFIHDVEWTLSDMRRRKRLRFRRVPRGRDAPKKLCFGGNLAAGHREATRKRVRPSRRRTSGRGGVRAYGRPPRADQRARREGGLNPRPGLLSDLQPRPFRI